MKRLEQFKKDRRDAVTRAVMNGDLKAARRYCKKYGVTIPNDDRIFLGAMCKVTVACSDVPIDVKKTAIRKCRELGITPFMIDA